MTTLVPIPPPGGGGTPDAPEDSSPITPPIPHGAEAVFRRDLQGMSISQILILVRQTVGSCENQIRELADGMQERADRAAMISAEIRTLMQLGSSGRERGGTGLYIEDGSADHQVADYGDYSRIMNAAAPDLEDGEEAVNRYNTLGVEIRDAANSEGALSQEQIDSLIQLRREELSTLNSGNEMQMMELQSLVQQRNQYISLGTQMIAAFGEANKQVAGNIR